MRGTGRSCGAAPNASSFSGAFDFTMTTLGYLFTSETAPDWSGVNVAPVGFPFL